MSISLKTHKMLWGRSANRCAFPECRRELVMDCTETDDESIIGDEAHIVAREEHGPRGQGSSLTSEQRDKYGNLILLCKLHHKLIDDQPGKYTVENLVAMKATHEKWVTESLTDFDPQKQRDDELYADYVERWADLAGLDDWTSFTVGILGNANAEIFWETYDQLRDLQTYMLSRVWPGRYGRLEAAFQNFREVLGDFLSIFDRYSIVEGEFRRTESFYKKAITWNPKLEALHEYHIDLLSDLAYELTRAANYVCDCVREELDRTFRIEKGVVLARCGPCGMDLAYYLQRTEYQLSERGGIPYPGLEKFVEVRTTRDRHYGEGAMEGYRLGNWPL
jgi:hypothetical protein